MILFSILLGLMIFGIYLTDKSWYYEFLGIPTAIVSGVFLIVHVCCWATSGYEFEKFAIERKTFVETLQQSRKGESALERASITRDVLKWNQELALRKYRNGTFFFESYIDDRTMALQPIN